MSARCALLLLALVVGCGQKGDASAIRPFLWTIEKGGTTSHLLGTMHTGVDPGRLPHVVWQTLEGARVAVFETDLTEAAALPVLRTDGSSLRDELGAEYWKKLEDTLGVDEASRLVGFKPLIPATLVAMHGLPRTASIDGALKEKAMALGKPVVYLEPLATQYAMLSRWLDLRALREMLDDIALLRESSRAMAAAYEAGDANGLLAGQRRELDRLLAKGRTQADVTEMGEDTLYRRNAAWITTIEKLHAEGGAFIAVGALHTVGPRSVVDLLEKQGFKVTRVAGTVRAH